MLAHWPLTSILYRVSVPPLITTAPYTLVSATSVNSCGCSKLIPLYTTPDNNCIEMQRREYVPQGDGVHQRNDPIAGNYYPATCMSFTRDLVKDLQLTLLYDRAHGVSSQINGSIEVMYHRRILYVLVYIMFDGVNNITFVINVVRRISKARSIWTTRTIWRTSKPYLMFGDVATSTRLRHRLQYFQNFPPTVAYGTSPTTIKYTPTWSAFAKPFPDNVHVLSLLHYNNSTAAPTSETAAVASPKMMLRLNHIYETGRIRCSLNPLRSILHSTSALQTS